MPAPIVDDLRRVFAGALAVPVGALATAMHRWADGSAAVLELRVRAWNELPTRTHVLRRLRRVGADPSVAALWLRIDGTPGSWAACQDLRAALARVRAAGKRVYASVEAPGNAATWLASVADKVFVTPMGEVGLLGVGAELTFLGEALERLGIQPDFEAAGAYKSFGEPFTRRFASPENQEAVRALVDDLQDQLVAGIAEGRGLSREAVMDLLARAPIGAEDAVEAGLVDRTAYEDEVHDWIETEHGKRARFVKFVTWARRDLLIEWIESWGGDARRIAIVHLQGPVVVDDRSPSPMIRARRVVPVLRRLRESEKVQAVVLHVDSPGGSALASDLIWREVDLLRQDKPVIASFEDVAASGGYYLAAPAVEILARPGTLTGSIGVFGGKLVAAEGLRRVGVHTQEVVSAPNATLFSPTQPFTDAQRQRFRASLQRFYDGFVERVAAGRRQPPEAIEPHCRGRVWTGRLAHERGLVDRYGDLFDALERARSLSGLHVDGFRVVDVSVNPPRTWISRLMSAAFREFRPRFVEQAMGPLGAAVVRQIGASGAQVLDLVGRHVAEPLALLPFDLRLR